MPWTPEVSRMLRQAPPSKKARGRAQQTAAHRRRKNRR